MTESLIQEQMEGNTNKFRYKFSSSVMRLIPEPIRQNSLHSQFQEQEHLLENYSLLKL